MKKRTRLQVRRNIPEPQRRNDFSEDELNRRDHCRSLYREHIQSCATYANEMLRGCFILNGVAVTAILASDKFDALKWATLFFTIAALLSIISGLFAYLYQLNTAKSWKCYLTNENYTYTECYLVAAFFCGGGSLLLFIIGLTNASCNLLI